MKANQPLEYRTRMFSRVMGPYLIVVAAAVALRPAEMKPMVAALTAIPLWSWVTGSFTLLLGLTVVALHPYWRGSAAILVSLLGWLVTAKGFMLLLVPHTYLSISDAAVGAADLWRSAAVIYLVIGLHLTNVGWISKRERPPSRTAASAAELPRAA